MRYERPFDLHALSTPPAFILDQDQILKKMSLDIVLGQLKKLFIPHPCICKGDGIFYLLLFTPYPFKRKGDGVFTFLSICSFQTTVGAEKNQLLKARLHYSGQKPAVNLTPKTAPWYSLLRLTKKPNSRKGLHMFVLYGEGLPPATTCFQVGQEVQHDGLSFRINGIDTVTNTVTAEVTKAGKDWKKEGVRKGTQIEFHPHSNWEKEGPWWLSQSLPGQLPSIILAAGGEIV